VEDVLDSFVWHSLTTSHARFAEGAGPARRFQPAVAIFAAVEHDGADAWATLAELVGPGSVALLSGDLARPPAGWTEVGGGEGFQMVLDAEAPTVTVRGADVVALGADDVDEVLALVEATQPGPFRARTIELGDYVGVRDDAGALVAMAGERLRAPGFTEISAVCTLPAARGRGLAAMLTGHVAAGIRARGDVPLLHVARTNTTARRVYERLGFAVRRPVDFIAARAPT
jgi:predicted GNAT family acetyltransferase